MKQLCVISCPIETSSGYGARSRDFVKAIYELKKDEWDIQILSQRWGATPWTALEENTPDNNLFKSLINRTGQLPRQPDVWFQITIPNEFQPVGKVNFGVTAGIETTICAPGWIDGCNRMTATFVSSKHAKQVFESSIFEEKDKNTGQIIRKIKLEKPVHVLFEGVDLNKYFFIPEEQIPATELMSDINAIKEEFCFLHVGHWLQGEYGEDRKNTGMLVKLFLETFKDRKKQPALILKTSHAGPSIMDREEVLKKINNIRNSVQSKNLPNIYLLHGDLDDSEVNCLYNHPKVKAFVTLTKGEGFGRPLAEFCLSKKPIIATGWSGHLDFLSPEFSVLLPGDLTPIHPSAQVKDILIEGAHWFSVNPAMTCKALLDVYENYKNYETGGRRQGFKIKTEFSYDNMVLLLKSYIESSYVPKQVELAMPQMKKIELPKLKKLS